MHRATARADVDMLHIYEQYSSYLSISMSESANRLGLSSSFAHK